MNEISVIDFVQRLYKTEDLRSLYERGLIDAEDVHQPDKALTRGDAARLSHLYLLREKNIQDLKNITEAEALRDLYDCRVCANHIAQVFLRGIMFGTEIPGIIEGIGKGFLLFDTRKKIDPEEAENIIERLNDIK